MKLDTKLLERALKEYREYCEALSMDLDETCEDTDFAEIAFSGRSTVDSMRSGYSKAIEKIKEGKSVTPAVADSLLMAHRKRYQFLVETQAENDGGSKALDLDDEAICCEKKIRSRLGISPWIPEPDGRLADGFLRARDFKVRDQLPDSSTRSLALHDVALFRAYAQELKAQDPGIGDAYPILCDYTKSETVEERPDFADLSDTEVLADSTVFDHTDWVAVPDSNDIRTRPIQMGYCTRVVEVKIPDDPPEFIGFEFNTGGFGVFPMPDPSLPEEERPRILMQRNTRMKEMPNCSEGRVAYLLYPIRKDLAGQSYTFTNRCIYINGIQDQYQEQGEDGEPVKFDWAGKRITPNSKNHDLAVLLSDEYGIDELEFRRRPEPADRDRRKKAVQQDERVDIDQKECCFTPGPQKIGTGVTGGQAIWFIPGTVKETTIFSFWWSWDWN